VVFSGHAVLSLGPVTARRARKATGALRSQAPFCGTRPLPRTASDASGAPRNRWGRSRVPPGSRVGRGGSRGRCSLRPLTRHLIPRSFCRWRKPADAPGESVGAPHGRPTAPPCSSWHPPGVHATDLDPRGPAPPPALRLPPPAPGRSHRVLPRTFRTLRATSRLTPGRVPRAPGTHRDDECGAATYDLSTPRASPGTHPLRMGDAALHLGLLEQPGRTGGFQRPARLRSAGKGFARPRRMPGTP
jgi:hypothetical protein